MMGTCDPPCIILTTFRPQNSCIKIPEEPFSGIWRKPGIVCLLILSLPWTASLEFFLGYPLRLLTSINAEIFLNLTGTDVNRAGVQLLYGGRVVGVDPACSGMNMLWSTGLLTALLAAVFSLRWRAVVPLGMVALLLALAGNSLRATVLFFPEVGFVEMPHLLHAGIGIAIAGGCFFVLMKLARRLSANGALALAGVSTALGFRQNAGIPRLSADLSVAIAALLVLVASFFFRNEPHHSTAAPSLLTSYRGFPITRIPLTPAEETFYGSFPGSIAVYEGADFKLIVRQVNRATRKLHPASHCLRAEGFRIGDKTVQGRWLSYTAERGGETFHVKERLTCPATEQSWPEISAWYWYALFHPSDGPWQAVTVISG